MVDSLQAADVSRQTSDASPSHPRFCDVKYDF
jgi:hypothetical protein